jgi:hypothetical protein
MRRLFLPVFTLLFTATAHAGVGDPQLATDHPWYPGELACSTFDRLFATEAAVFQRVVGRPPTSDEDKALASWLWRSTHYFHGEEGTENLWGKGFRSGDLRTREYWTGLFSHGFGLCGTTHAQWSAEFHHLLGPHRGRDAGANGHNAFEAFLTGGPYGDGKWVLIDHDLCTVVFDPSGRELLSAAEVSADWRRLTDRKFRPERQHGWPICGLDQGDAASYSKIDSAEYGPGYDGPPPTVHLRRGETYRRYFEPGLDDGKTFVFWGRNAKDGKVPGPSRNLTWVNQPDRFYGRSGGPGFRSGLARYGNAVFTYSPNFADGSYREGVVSETPDQVVFEFMSPFVIAATPPNDSPWAIYDVGGTNGLIVSGKANCPIAVSVDRGQTWIDGGKLPGRRDLTDHVKGYRQYWLRFNTSAAKLRDSDLTMRTVCQANPAVFPRLTNGGTTVRYAASGRAIVSAGPTLPQAKAHVVAGGFGTPTVILELPTPRGERALAIYAVAHMNSGNPPDPNVKYQIDYSIDGGTTWLPIVRDWSIPRRGAQSNDFWSQTLVWGSAELSESAVKSVRVRFRNDGRKAIARAEMHLAYEAAGGDVTAVTFAWDDDSGPHQHSHTVPVGESSAEWRVPTGRNVRTRFVEMKTQ